MLKNSLKTPKTLKNFAEKMTKKKKYSYDYSSLNLRATVVIRFRKFARQLARSQSDTLEVMLHFFEWHDFLPTQKFEKKLMEEIRKNRKRTEANIAILRDIEKTQTKPLSVQMDLLFEGQTKQEHEPKLVEKKFAASSEKNKGKELNTVHKLKYQKTKTELKQLKKEFRRVLDKVLQSKNSFGKSYLKLELPLSELHRIKETLKKE